MLEENPKFNKEPEREIVTNDIDELRALGSIMGCVIGNSIGIYSTEIQLSGNKLQSSVSIDYLILLEPSKENNCLRISSYYDNDNCT